MLVKKIIHNLRQSRIASIFSNCGGMNYLKERFSGNLVRHDLTIDEFLAIYHSLIFPNGVRKTTLPARNIEVIRELFFKNLLPDKKTIRILDIGSSAGLDAFNTYEFLRTHYHISQYVLGDLYTKLLYEPDLGLVFDEDRNLLQVRVKQGFFAMHFSYQYAIQKILFYPKYLKTTSLRKSLLKLKPKKLITIPLCHTKVDITSISTPFKLQRMDVFNPPQQQFDLIICMHLLVSRYFSKQQIDQGTQNLLSMLNESGVLIVGAREKFDVFKKPLIKQTFIFS